jgi:hypothetical protein
VLVTKENNAYSMKQSILIYKRNGISFSFKKKKSLVGLTTTDANFGKISLLLTRKFALKNDLKIKITAKLSLKLLPHSSQWKFLSFK